MSGAIPVDDALPQVGAEFNIVCVEGQMRLKRVGEAKITIDSGAGERACVLSIWYLLKGCAALSRRALDTVLPEDIFCSTKVKCVSRSR